MLSKQTFAIEDAKEMMHILQTSRCIARYDHISHELLSELLVAIATGGEVLGGNNLGSDVRSPSHGLIEVKSENPRLRRALSTGIFEAKEPRQSGMDSCCAMAS